MSSNLSKNYITLENKAFIFGGAYGNLEATKAILLRAKEMGFKRSEIIFTGDMVAYCANPVETVELIRNDVDHIIMGNCEEALAAGSDNCGCGFESGSECNLLSKQWYEYCLSKIDREIAVWMGKLPRNLDIEISNMRFLATHASPASINEFIFASNLDGTELSDQIDGMIVGHSGLPFIAKKQNKLWLNSGAAGMPANDGTSRVWYATIYSKKEHLEVQTHCIEYDFISTQEAMLKAGLKNGYADCLQTGIWPSHDVLPKQEKEQTGFKISSQKKALQRAPSK